MKYGTKKIGLTLGLVSLATLSFWVLSGCHQGITVVLFERNSGISLSSMSSMAYAQTSLIHECTSKLENQLVYNQEKSVFQVCRGSVWTEIEVATSGNVGPAGPKGEKGDAGPSSNVYVADQAAPTNHVYVNSAGRIGVGTSDPGTELHIAASAARPQIRVGIDNGSNAVNGTSVGDYEFSARYGGSVNEIANIRGFYTGDGTNRVGEMGLFTTNSSAPLERMRIAASGNIGIGTTSPQSTFHVSESDSSVTGVRNVLRIDRTTTGTAAPGIGAGLKFITQDDAGTLQGAAEIHGILTDVTNGAERGALAVRTKGAGGAMQERVRVDSSGQVGIGRTVPVATLDINGFMRLTPNASAPVACSGTVTGSIALKNDYTLCVCNGVTWIQSHNGSSCSW